MKSAGAGPESNLEHILNRQVRRLSFRIGKLQQTSQLYSRIRLLIALAGIAVTAACFQYGSNRLGWIATAVVATAFCIVLYGHGRHKESINRYRILLNLRVAQIARLRLDWDHIPAAPAIPVHGEHPFGVDLDITGERSLHQLIDNAITAEGSRKLWNFLMQTDPELDGILRRQMLVKELSRLTLFRHKLIVNGMRLCEGSCGMLDIRSVLQWFKERGSKAYVAKALLPLTILAFSNWAIFGLVATDMIPPYYLILFFVYLAPLLFLQIDIGKAFGEATAMESELDRLFKVFRSLERYGYSGTPNLARLCQPFLDRQDRPSAHLRRISRIVSGISVRSNPVAWLLLNGILPWDIYFIRRLDQCKRALSVLMTSWLDVLTEVEALGSLANFAYLNPDFKYPELETGHSRDEPNLASASMHFRAEGLGHPLIPPRDRVCNSLTFDEGNRIALITGSNMAGKSSFLRTIGVNLCLAYAGAPVCASSLRTSLLRIFACMRINDSLTDGFSFFYAEVKRLKMLLATVEASHGLPVLFLLDEIFRGTNNHERFIGSRAYIRALAQHPVVGAIATHDLELVKLADENRIITNYHFREEVADGRMIFDYRLRPGPCPTTNALKIMAMAGLPV